MKNAFFRFEKSTLFLFLSNILIIVVALVEKWNLSQIMWIYWGQSVVIGYYNWRRIRGLKQFSTEGFKLNEQSVKPTKATQKQVASFFLVHYGLFHLVYMFFLFIQSRDLSQLDTVGVLVCIAVFGFNHRFSFQHNLHDDLSRKPNIGTIMFFPYARIMPMHITIIFGSQFANKTTGILILFLGLKTIADVIMHQIEHRQNRQLN